MHRQFDWALGTQPVEPVSSFVVGISVFTPDHLAEPDPIYDDRPYASYLFIGTEQRRLIGRKTILTSHVSLGALGLGIGEAAQTGIHVGLRGGPEVQTGPEDPRDPQGWSNQISDAGEPSARLAASIQHSLFHGHTRSGFGVEVVPGASVTTLIDNAVSASLGIRLLNAATPWTSYLRDPGNNPDAGPSGIPTASPRLFSLEADPPSTRDLIWTGKEGRIRWLSVPQVWGFVEGTYDVYNVMLQGQFRDSAVEYDHCDVRHFHLRASAGISMTVLNLNLGYAMHTRSPDLSFGPTKDRWHGWGTLTVGWRKLW